MPSITMYAVKQISDLTLKRCVHVGNRKDCYMYDGEGDVYRMTSNLAKIKLFNEIKYADRVITKALKNISTGDIESGSVDLKVVPVTISL